MKKRDKGECKGGTRCDSRGKKRGVFLDPRGENWHFTERWGNAAQGAKTKWKTGNLA